LRAVATGACPSALGADCSAPISPVFFSVLESRFSRHPFFPISAEGKKEKKEKSTPKS